MNYLDVINDPGSTTKAFKILSTDYELEVLSSKEDGGLFKRVVVIKLDQVPVMVALSQTSIDSLVFLDILKNAATTPIGVKLFAPNSQIVRGKMAVKNITLNQIQDKVIRDYLEPIVTNESELYHRQSVFSYKTQTMKLIEYVLPGLKQIVEK